jgi:hypothetical protein
MNEAELLDIAQKSIERHLPAEYEPRAEIFRGFLVFSAGKNGKRVGIKSPLFFAKEAADILKRKHEEPCAKPS